MAEILAPDAPLPDWARGRINLASPRLGTAAVSSSDEFFAPMARLIQDGPALFRPGIYDAHGKWMDGWESRRRRDAGHDWCVIRLGVAGRIAGVDIDTSHFTGNYPRAASLWAARGEAEPGVDGDWTEILPAQPLGPSAHHFARVAEPGPWRWLRLNIYPDGGVARLRVFGDPAPEWAGAGVVELSALKNGGRVVAYNDAHYGDVWAILTEGRGRDMGDGWETRRRREPGHDWIIVALGAAGVVEQIEIDTAHYKGNFPDRASVQAARVSYGTDDSVVSQAMFWPEILAPQKLMADHVHLFEVAPAGPVSHVKLNIHPDGGVSRFRVFGRRA
ncbi:MAG TPA: allantoicase [Paracoccaceae bacterium]|nr:allantoicase [Paracoccaceae bacterium]